jgi:hypothetical protein
MVTRLATTFLLAAAVVTACAATNPPSDDRSPRPLQTAAGELSGQGSVYGMWTPYDDNDFKTPYRFALTPGGNMPFDKRLSLQDTGIEDNISSIRWKIPPGLVVVLYEHESGAPGKQFIMFGTGQVANLKDHGFNDSASSWAIYRLCD